MNCQLFHAWGELSKAYEVSRRSSIMPPRHTANGSSRTNWPTPGEIASAEDRQRRRVRVDGEKPENPISVHLVRPLCNAYRHARLVFGVTTSVLRTYPFNLARVRAEREFIMSTFDYFARCF